MESTGTSSCNSNNNGVKLLDAAMEGLADDAIEILAKNPALVHIADPMGDTAFHMAARAGHGPTVLKMIEFLKRGHVKILVVVLCEGNTHGDTPLHLALKNGHNDIAVRLAIPITGTIFIKNHDQESPADLANQAGIDLLSEIMHPDLEKSPLKRVLKNEHNSVHVGRFSSGKVDIEMRLAKSKRFAKDGGDDDEEKWLKLYKAAETRGKDDEVMEILEDDPKTLERKKPSGWTALHVAASCGNMGPLKKMVEFIDNNHDLKWLLLEGDRRDSTPLHHAIEYGHEKVARYLIEVAPRAIYKINRVGRSPLCLAIGKGYLDLVRYMTRSDLSRSIREQIVEQARKVFIVQNILKDRKLGALQAIVEGLPDVIYLPDEKGWKPLSFVASKGYLDEFNYILKNFPDSARKIDEDGSFPIHKAVAGGHVSIVKEFLLCCPQALKDIDTKGRNLVELATLYQRKDVVSYLKERSI